MGGITARWAHDVRDYAVENNLVLPGTWDEFISWKQRSQPSYKISAQDLNSRFRILERHLTGAMNGKVFIEVIDPEIKEMEETINRIVRSAVTERVEERSAGIGESAPVTDQPEEPAAPGF